MSTNHVKDSKSTDTGTQKNPVSWFFSWFFRRPGMLILFIILALALPVLVLIQAVIIPAATFEPIPQSVIKANGNDTIFQKMVQPQEDQRDLYLKILNQEQKLSFYQNRLLLARQDSIYLVLNLQDSTLDIEIKGLAVHRCKLLEIDASKRLQVAQHEELQQWLGQPFTLKDEISTIPKVPILVVDAPKDTTEAAKLPKKPMEPEKTVVYFSLIFDKNLVVQIQQIEPYLLEEEALVKEYYEKTTGLYKRSLMDKILSPMPENLPVFIHLKMNEGDARTIYRSIPHANFAKLIINPLDEKM